VNSIPIWFRLWLLGTLWGTVCGVASAWLWALWASVAWGRSDGINDVLVSIALVAVLGAFYGGTVGFILGSPTGLVAGLLLTVLLRVAAPRTAARSVVVLVLLLQLWAGLAIFGAPTRGSWWAYVLVPAITVVPLALTVRGAVRDGSRRTIDHRDTLAA
jgi:hypothetical protein